jgi:hypothetical protein
MDEPDTADRSLRSEIGVPGPEARRWRLLSLSPG